MARRSSLSPGGFRVHVVMVRCHLFSDQRIVTIALLSYAFSERQSRHSIANVRHALLRPGGFASRRSRHDTNAIQEPKLVIIAPPLSEIPPRVLGLMNIRFRGDISRTSTQSGRIYKSLLNSVQQQADGPVPCPVECIRLNWRSPTRRSAQMCRYLLIQETPGFLP
jgi:hypothetical protein